MTKQERLKDELVLAAIIAGAKGDGRQVRRGRWGVKALDAVTPPIGPCCAVGAGCLFAGLRALNYDHETPLEALARVHQVPTEYAMGVSDGFEDAELASLHPAYARGVAVGSAAGAILNPTSASSPFYPW